MTKIIELTQEQASVILAGLRKLHQATLMQLEFNNAQPNFEWSKIGYQKDAEQQLEVIQHLLRNFHSKSRGVCPICHGFGWDRIPEHSRKWYPEKLFMQCRNCGGQYQGGVTETSRGMVNLHRISGLPCSHDYTSRNTGRCLNEYTCKNCGDKHEIDSGD